jgi:hypothetical protein
MTKTFTTFYHNPQQTGNRDMMPAGLPIQAYYRFGMSNLVIGICLGFVVWCLEFSNAPKFCNFRQNNYFSQPCHVIMSLL